MNHTFLLSVLCFLSMTGGCGNRTLVPPHPIESYAMPATADSTADSTRVIIHLGQAGGEVQIDSLVTAEKTEIHIKRTAKPDYEDPIQPLPPQPKTLELPQQVLLHPARGRAEIVLGISFIVGAGFSLWETKIFDDEEENDIWFLPLAALQGWLGAWLLEEPSLESPKKGKHAGR